MTEILYLFSAYSSLFSTFLIDGDGIFHGLFLCVVDGSNGALLVFSVGDDSEGGLLEFFL